MDQAYFKKLVHATMPFGKYQGKFLVDLPEDYLLWLEKKGWPNGEIGIFLSEICEMKRNGLEDLLYKIKKEYETTK